jgi:ketosteroid isomerase-like protein
MVDANETVLQQLVSDKVSYGHSSGKVEGKVSFINSLSSGASDFVSIDVRAQSVEVLANTAIVRHEIHAQTQDGGKPGAVSLYILLIWQKQEADWQLIARQAVRMPQ